MSHRLHVFLLISLHELTPITDAYRWNAHDHLEQTIQPTYSIHFIFIDLFIKQAFQFW